MRNLNAPSSPDPEKKESKQIKWKDWFIAQNIVIVILLIGGGGMVDS